MILRRALARALSGALAGGALVLGPLSAARAQDAGDLKAQVESLRREFESVRRLYEERLRAIGQRIRELEAAQAGAAAGQVPGAPEAPATPAPAAAAPAPAPSTLVPAGPVSPPAPAVSTASGPAPAAAPPTPVPSTEGPSPLDLLRPRQPFALAQPGRALLFDVGVSGDFVANFTSREHERLGDGTFAGRENRVFPREVSLGFFGRVDPYASNMPRVTATLVEGLSRIAPELAGPLEANRRAFLERVAAADRRWKELLAPHRGARVVSHHDSWPYFLEAFGLIGAGTIEDRPGVPPSPQHLSSLIRTMKETRVRAILVETWYLADTARAVARETGAKVLVLPQTPGAVKGTEDYIGHLEYLVTRIADALK